MDECVRTERAAVKSDTNAMPIIITRIPMIRPSAVLGYKSPQPTVVAVTTDHQTPSHSVGNSSASKALDAGWVATRVTTSATSRSLTRG
jgi:hypothetical protein